METKSKRKWIIGIIIGVFIILSIIVGIIGFSMYNEYKSRGEGSGEFVTLEIKQGDSSKVIANKLKEAELIKYPIVFQLKVKEMGVGAKLRYGTFSFRKGAGIEYIIENLISGGALKEETLFTVPEGYTIEQIARKLEEENFCTEEDFLEAVQKDYDYWFLESIPEDTNIKYRLQGFLFPSTYAISEDMQAEDIVKVMLNQFNKIFTAEMKETAEKLEKSVYQVVIEASIIEREVVLDEERVMVAGVIKNRLEINMKLEMCPTVLYPLTEGFYDKDKVTNEDTKYDSPYNTYLYEGLPPGPIANPGVASLEAALNPAEHEFFYYHTDNEKKDGSHIFSETYEEHVGSI